MGFELKKLMAAAAIAVVAPMAAGAAVIPDDRGITGGAFYDFGGFLPGFASETYTFTADEDLFVSGISFSGTDDAPSTLEALMFSVNGIMKSFDSIGGGDGSAGFGGFGSLNGDFNVASGSTINFGFSSSSPNQAGIAFSFRTGDGFSQTPIPVPAAGVLLGGLMAAGAFAARRKAKKAA
jgi:hypothetical protein